MGQNDSDALARALDGRQLSNRTTIRVVGVHAEGPSVWVQVVLEPHGRELVLHVRPGADADATASTLERHLTQGPHDARVLDVQPS